MLGWGINWGPVARTALLNMPWNHAERVDAAVLRYAATGKGDTSKVAEERFGVWLRASGYVVRLRLYPASRTVGVLYMFRAGT